MMMSSPLVVMLFCPVSTLHRWECVMWKGGGVGCWNAGDSHNNIMAMAIRIINTWWYPKNGTKPVNQCVSRVGPIVVLITTMVVTYASTLLEIFLSPCWLNVMCASLPLSNGRPKKGDPKRETFSDHHSRPPVE